MIIYKRKHGETQPTAVECETFEPLREDSDGETIYENTHFATITESFEDMITDYTAGISLTVRALIRARDAVANLQNRLADESILLHKTRENFEDWQAANEPDGAA